MKADGADKHGLLRFEPWKLFAVSFGAGAAVMGVALALVAALFNATEH